MTVTAILTVIPIMIIETVDIAAGVITVGDSASRRTF
jgi:hypothetical protein